MQRWKIYVRVDAGEEECNVPVQVNASVGKLSECSLLLQLSGLLGILLRFKSVNLPPQGIPSFKTYVFVVSHDCYRIARSLSEVTVEKRDETGECAVGRWSMSTICRLQVFLSKAWQRDRKVLGQARHVVRNLGIRFGEGSRCDGGLRSTELIMQRKRVSRWVVIM